MTLFNPLWTRAKIRTERIIIIHFLLSIAQELDPRKVVGGLRLSELRACGVYFISFRFPLRQLISCQWLPIGKRCYFWLTRVNRLSRGIFCSTIKHRPFVSLDIRSGQPWFRCLSFSFPHIIDFRHSHVIFFYASNFDGSAK